MFLLKKTLTDSISKSQFNLEEKLLLLRVYGINNRK